MAKHYCRQQVLTESISFLLAAIYINFEENFSCQF